jgi:signal transduction histidine kinase/ligand-binding sensor domain-containing protein
VLLKFVRIMAMGVCSGLLCGPALAGSAINTPTSWVARVWQLDDGLPDNNITGIAQSRDGYLWLGTHRGLVRFDGVRFVRVALPVPDQLSYGLIRGLSLLHEDELWVTMVGRVAVCLKSGQTRVFTKEDGLSQTRSMVRPMAAVEGQEGSAWIGYYDGFAYRIANGNITCFSTDEGLTGVGYCRLASDRNGRLWFANAGRVGLFRDGKFIPLLTLTNQPLCIAPARHEGIWICSGVHLLHYNGTGEPKELARLPTNSSTAEPTALLEDREGALWIGTTADGLFRYDGTQAVVRVVTSHNHILSLAEDREGNIWVGTAGGGLNRLRPRVMELEGNSTRLPHEAVRSVCQDSSGTLWVVGQDGELSRQQQEGWRVLSAKDGWIGGAAFCLASGLQGEVWIGTAHNGLYRWQDGSFTHLGRNEGLAGETVQSLLSDSKGNLWIGLAPKASVQRLREGTFTTFPQPQDEFPIRTISEDASGCVWMIASDGRLLRVSGDTLVDETRGTQWQAIQVRSLHATSDGSLWIGCSGSGLGRLRDGKLATIGIEQGLLDTHVSGIANDDEGNLWLASDRGIFKVRQRELDAVAERRSDRVLAIAYGRDQALPNLQANAGYSPTSMRTRDGRILFPMTTGLAIIHPERVQPNAFAPPVLVEGMTVDGRDIDLSNSGREPGLPAGHRKVELEFTALSFVTPENTHFRHRLMGWDETWQETQYQRSVSYTRLPAGEYVFQVRACNESGVWSEPGVELRFHVHPFLWQTWWFRTLALATLAGLVAVAVRQYEHRKHLLEMERLEREAMVERERARVAQDLHDDLGSGLTEIGLMASLAQRQNLPPERVHQHLQQVTDKAREMVTALDEIVWAVNPRHDSVISLSHYLCEYAQRFLELTPIRCRLEVARDLPARPLKSDQRHSLFLAFKEALTNVARHSQAAEARIRISADANVLTVAVEDNGRGVDDLANHHGADGLSNMQRRLEQIGGRCEIQSQPNRGTQVRFVLPLAKAGKP